MRKIIKLTEADVRRLVEKAINEQCGEGGKTTNLGFADLGGMGMGFDIPIESRYQDDEDEEVIDVMFSEQNVQDDEEETGAVKVDDEDEDDFGAGDEEGDDEEGDDEEEDETKPGISGGSGKFSDKDVTDVKLFKDGKKQFNQLTINQKTLIMKCNCQICKCGTSCECTCCDC